MQKTFKWISLTAAAAILAAGCAAGPQRAPNRNAANPPVGSSLTSTTGDADACAVALGNAVAHGGLMNPGAGAGMRTYPGTANGLLIGNVALIALPSAGTATTGVPPANPGGVPAADSAFGGTAGGTTGGTTAGTTGGMTGGAAGGTTAAYPLGGARGRTGTSAPPVALGDNTVAPGNPTLTGTADRYVNPNMGGSPTATGTTGGTTAANADTAAIDRVKSACDKVADVRVVNNDNDRRRLSEITAAMRRGEPLTNFMAELTRIAQGATSAGSGRNANQSPVTVPSPTAPSPTAGGPANRP